MRKKIATLPLSVQFDESKASAIRRKGHYDLSAMGSGRLEGWVEDVPIGVERRCVMDPVKIAVSICPNFRSVCPSGNWNRRGSAFLKYIG